MDDRIVFEKVSKPNTKAQSFQLFQQGKSIEAIAKERSLAMSTIESHLLPYVKSGEIPLEKLVSPEKAGKIIDVFRQNPEITLLSEIKALLGDDYSYSEIRFVQEVAEIK